ncbi:MAG TPA: sodium-independent anion transporter, partial [Magnetospirillaceae bacterium]|nr:sodium-independent anion transporter [Magnetospirillaceae bacterium]
ILIGFGLGALLFLHRIAQSMEIERDTDVQDSAVYRISGAFFFGTAAGVAAALDRPGEQPNSYVIDLSAVPVVDSTAAATIAAFVRKAGERGARVVVTGANARVRRALLIQGVRRPTAIFQRSRT